MMKIIRGLLLAGICTATALTPASANHSWGNYHWARSSNPVKLQINTALTGTWSSYVGTAVGQWNQSSKLDFFAIRPVNVSTKKCDPIAGQVLVCNSSYGQRGWLGIASIWANGDHITQATTKLNDTYFNMARYSGSAWRAMVACQEIGHDFGLGHQDEGFSNENVGSCMDYTNDPSGTAGTNGSSANIAPNSHDYQQLDTIYDHLDTTNTATAAVTDFGIRQVGKPAAAGQDRDAGVGDTMADWGRAIHQDGKGRPDIFVRQLADGRTVITHVLWAPDAKGNEAG